MIHAPIIPPSEAESRPSLHILVIEDDECMREVLAALLEHAGHHVLTAVDGHEGIAFAGARQPDIIFCDVNMPGISGHEVLRTLQSDYHTRHIPFVFLTGCLDRESIRIGMASGASQYLAKPFRTDELNDAIDACRHLLGTFEHACEVSAARLRCA